MTMLIPPASDVDHVNAGLTRSELDRATRVHRWKRIVAAVVIVASLAGVLTTIDTTNNAKPAEAATTLCPKNDNGSYWTEAQYDAAGLPQCGYLVPGKWWAVVYTCGVRISEGYGSAFNEFPQLVSPLSSYALRVCVDQYMAAAHIDAQSRYYYILDLYKYASAWRNAAYYFSQLVNVYSYLAMGVGQASRYALIGVTYAVCMSAAKVAMSYLGPGSVPVAHQGCATAVRSLWDRGV